MKSAIINTLNKLNQDFYGQVCDSFNKTRQNAWTGWQALVPFIKQLPSPRRVLDLGCGNARFAKFLHSAHIQSIYHGIDSNSELLSLAKNSFSDSDSYQLAQLDIIQTIQDLPTIPAELDQKHYDLVVAFGLLHHIPSYQLRLNFLRLITHLLQNKNSLAVISAWQFASDNRIKNKLVSPTTIGIDAQEIEKSDYLLGWQDRTNLYRYCHDFSDQEMNEILNQLENVQLLFQYSADGKSGKLNHYYLLQRISDS
ncbi:MAG TPA: class I SAM-dependent methyltransferase [Candidatus Woesebacteria bacterium]|nr:class I SAM-dependent methyltransferase [Candidatus Woesebacteria bacterium]